MRRRAFIGAALAFAASCARGEAPSDLSASSLAPPAPGCVGLACRRVDCGGAPPTRITGRVTDPAGRRGLYNVSVYIPDAAPPPVRHGARCDACARRRVDAVASALTDPRGEFVLGDVPVGEHVPVVVELGAFRRTLDVTVAACAETRLADDVVRLPRSSAEGELPRVAVTTGAADALECLLRNVGIDEREIVAGGDPRGAVHVYRGRGGGGVAGAFVPDAAELWNDAARLSAYDLVALSCEGTEALENKGGDAPGARGSMAAYAEAGGHVFATHLHASWLKSSPVGELRSIAEWNETNDVGDEYEVDTTFPKGRAFAEWLSATGASPVTGKIRLDNVTFSVGGVRRPPAQPWIQKGPSAVRYFSFNMPLGASREDACGRVVFGDLHAFGLGGSDFPTGCPAAGELTPQQLALEFLLFDLFACVDDDAVPPAPPR